MSKKAKLLSAILVGSLLTIGGASLHTPAKTVNAKNVNLLAAPAAQSSVKAYPGLLNQSINLSVAGGKVLNNVPAKVLVNGKVVFDGDVYNNQINLNNYYMFGQLVDGLNLTGNVNVTIEVQGYNAVSETLNIKKMYSMTEMHGLNAGTKVDALINGKVQNFDSVRNGSLFLYSDAPFTFAPANMNDNFGRQYQMESWQYSVTPFYVIENTNTVALTKSEPKAYDYAPSQTLTFKNANGSLVKNGTAVTITAGGKTLYTGTTLNGVVDINNYYIFGELIDGLNQVGTKEVTIHVDGFKPFQKTLNIKKMYGMVEMHDLDANTNVDAIVNGKLRHFKPVMNGSLFIFSDSPFTFAPANMNDSFGRQYQMASWVYGVTPYYVVTNSIMTL